MFYDLRLPDGSGGLNQRNRAAMAIKLGVGCIATAKTVTDRLTEAHRCSIPQLEATTLAAADTSPQAAVQLLQPASTHELHQLSRLTIATAEAPLAVAATAPTNSISATYDILAVQPLSERVLMQACSSLEVDVIALDLSGRMGFQLRTGPLSAAVRRGIHFEILYAPALRDETSRRHLFSNAAALVRATRGKGIIVSSGARDAFELRGPYDVINIAVLFGLSEHQAKAAICENAALVLTHARRRKAYKGTIVVETLPHQHEAASGDSKAAGDGNRLLHA